ncbi:MAG: DNA cytosine methyltransferase [Phycisphaera sp.]|nr:MAG: DNA cytosine methyltransferase [Phycisphaera sp.]
MTGLIIDNFAGAGGASVGIEAAMGRPVDYAINHDPEAIETHAVNHPGTEHLVENVFAVDPAKLCAGRPVDLAWFSPDCTHHSRAKGGKPRDNTRRGLAWVVIDWARAVRPAVIMLENVPEFQEWGPLDGDGRPCQERKGDTFRSWTGKLRELGYDVQWRELVAADYGTPTIRKRMFLVARCDGEPIVWPEPTHAPREKCEALGLKPWRAAAECIDWSLPCPSIFLTKNEARAWGEAHGVPAPKRPLADATMARIARGVQKYVVEGDPFIVSVAHGEVSPSGVKRWGNGTKDLADPLNTVLSGGGSHAVVAPSLVQTGYGERAGQAPRSLDIARPLGVVPAGGCKHALVAAFLAKHFGGVVGQIVDRPASTVTATDHHALVTSLLDKSDQNRRYGCTTQACQIAAFLTKYHGTGGQHAACGDPMHCVTCADRMALVTVAGQVYAIADLCMRMLQPHELLRAQFGRFAEGYELIGSKRRQVAGIGNSVCPEVAEALVRANVRAGTPTRDRKVVAA